MTFELTLRKKKVDLGRPCNARERYKFPVREIGWTPKDWKHC